MWMIIALLLGLTSSAQAQAQRESIRPINNLQTFKAPGTIPNISEILKNFHGSYSLSYMGPRINGTPEETYNIYLPDVSSVQFYHSLQLGYQVNENLQIGVGADLIQNLVDGVIGVDGTFHHRSSEWYDPYLYFNLPNLVKIEGWFIFTAASFSLPIGPASQNSSKISSLILRQSWSLNTQSRWKFGFNLFLNPQFYNDPLPGGYTDRQTLYFSVGPNFGYQFNSVWLLSMSSNFNAEHRSPNPNGFLSLGPAIPDTLQTSLTWSPSLSTGFLSIGGYFQSLVFSPSLDTSIVGGNFSIGF